jgi:hypothetical protein
MKNIFFIILVTLFVASCRDGIVSPGTTSNFITNHSFENKGAPSLRGWEVFGKVDFFRDTPPGGGTYSIGIESSWVPQYYAAYSLRVENGKRVYDFSCWAKAVQIPASINIIIYNDTVKYSKSIEVTDTEWRLYKLSDTITVSRGDSIKIYLNGSTSQLLPSTTYYDQCYLHIR